MRPRRCVSFWGTLACASLVTAPGAVRAQYLFGQNKVVYTPRAWKVISTPRVDLYYYEGEKELADYIAVFAESTCVEYESTFRHRFQNRIPFVLYASHHDFKQTNIIDVMISDYVGGFTELIRGRVAVPHTGSLTQLRNVTRHELVHAFMNDKLALLLNEKRRFNHAGMPLWFSEGLAEYIARPTPDTEARMFLRDLVVNDNLVELPELWRISGSFLMYKEGESLCGYIAARFGDEALVQLIESWWFSDRFDAVLEFTLGITEEELNRDWKRYLKRRYYPAVLDSEWPEQHGEALTQRRGISTRPVPVAGLGTPDGREAFVYLATPSGNVDVMLAVPDTLPHAPSAPQAAGYRHETLVRGGRNGRVESIPAFASGLAVHGSRLAFTSKSGARDALVLYDIALRREVGRFQTDSLIALSSPTWSPDGAAIAVAGLDGRGWQDLYRIDLATGSWGRLTHDPADDRDPSWHPDGTRIAWSSDRAAWGSDGVYHLFELDLASGEARALTHGDHEDAAPAWSPDGRRLLFTSDADGASNVYLLEDDQVRRLTATLGGMFTPCWTAAGDAFLASSFASTAFNIFQFPVGPGKETTDVPQFVVQPAAYSPPTVALPRLSAGREYPSRGYDVQWGLDYVRTAVAVDSDLGAGSLGQLGFTDVLGNHQIFLHVSNSAEDFKDFLNRLNLALTYTNRTRRLNYSAGVFHLVSLYDASQDRFRFERRYGTLVGVSYPLSRFQRLEVNLVGRVVERDAEDAALDGVGNRSFLLSSYQSFVHDNTQWSYAGPVDGMRFNLTVGHTVDGSGTRRGGSTVIMDWRTYRPLLLRSVYASRAAVRSSFGDNVQFFYLGGPFDLRGFEQRSLFARRLLLINQEIRFPLVDRLLIGMPWSALEFGGFRGALFADAAYLGQPFTPGWFGSFGVGAEMGIGGGIIMRMDWGRTHDFATLYPRSFRRFFLGWNY